MLVVARTSSVVDLVVVAPVGLMVVPSIWTPSNCSPGCFKRQRGEEGGHNSRGGSLAGSVGVADQGGGFAGGFPGGFGGGGSGGFPGGNFGDFGARGRGPAGPGPGPDLYGPGSKVSKLGASRFPDKRAKVRGSSYID